MRRTALFASALVLLAGCQSMRSWDEGCPAPYSGARYYADIRPTVPFDGKVFFTFDLIPTLLVDTLALPVTAFLEPTKPKGGYVVGCRWADARRRR